MVVDLFTNYNREGDSGGNSAGIGKNQQKENLKLISAGIIIYNLNIKIGILF